MYAVEGKNPNKDALHLVGDSAEFAWLKKCAPPAILGAVIDDRLSEACATELLLGIRVEDATYFEDELYHGMRKAFSRDAYFRNVRTYGHQLIYAAAQGNRSYEEIETELTSAPFTVKIPPIDTWLDRKGYTVDSALDSRPVTIVTDIYDGSFTTEQIAEVEPLGFTEVAVKHDIRYAANERGLPSVSSSTLIMGTVEGTRFVPGIKPINPPEYRVLPNTL